MKITRFDNMKMYRKKKISSVVVFTVVLVGLTGIMGFIPQAAEASELADSPWPMYGGGPKHTGKSPYDTSHVDGTEKWNFSAEDDILSSPAIGTDGTLYFGSYDNNLYAVNRNGTLRWEFTELYGPIQSSPAVAEDGTIYVGCNDKKLYAINPNGTEKWS